MAISTSFFLQYSKAEIKRRNINDDFVTVRCAILYTRSAMPFGMARRCGHQVIKKTVNTGIKAMPKYWRRGRVSNQHPGARQINEYLANLEHSALKEHVLALDEKKFPDQETFIAKIFGTESAVEKTFWDRYEMYIEYISHRGTVVQYIKRHIYIKKELLEFQRQTGYKIEFDSINKTFSEKFREWYSRTKPATKRIDPRRTAGDLVEHIKQFCSHAVAEGWTTSMIYRSIKKEAAPVKFPITLTPQEIAMFMAITDDGTRGRAFRNAINSRDWFILATQCGLRFSDWQADRIEIIDNRPAGMSIRFRQEKTGAPLEVPLSLLAMKIVEANGMKMPEAYSHGAIIDHMNLLAPIAGVKKRITTHMARRTFCTLQEMAGVPRNVIMRISGHKSEDDYLRYVGISFKTNADLLRKANPDWYVLAK